eukprot:g1722.t1
MDPHERKVRMVYDAIRAKNWKGAIKMVESALHKFKNSPVLKSLKAFSLEKLGKLDQAFELCEEIRSTGTIDEQVLHTLGMVYRSMDRMDCLTAAYVVAVEQNGNDLDLLQGLFSCHVRDCAFAKQQQLAMKIYKVSTQSDKYLWWVVVSIVLQVWNRPGRENSPPPLGIEKTLKLAQSFIQKQLQTNKELRSLEGLFLYIDILYRQGNAKQVWELLNTDLTKICKQPMQLMVLKAQCLVALGDFEGASASLREILSTEPDYWTGINALLDLYLPIENSREPEYPAWCDLNLESSQLIINHNEAPESSLTEPCINAEEAERAINFIQSTFAEKVQSASTPNPSWARCSALVEVEYNYRRMKCSLCEESELQESIIRAFEIMGQLGSVSNDLDVYIKHLTAPEKLYERFEAKRKEMSEENSSLVNLLQILCSLDAVWEPELTAKLTTDVLKHSELDSAIVSALSMRLLQSPSNLVFLELGTSVWEAFLIAGIASSTQSRPPSINLAHSALFFLLGAPNKGLEILELMEVKHTQLDSIASHFWYPFMRCYHCQGALRKFTIAAMSLFSTQKSDVEEMTFTAYQQGTYTKILEFVSFKDRLEMSHTFHMIKCDQSISQIISSIRSDLKSVEQSVEEACVELEPDKVNGSYFSRLIFNEDVQTRPQWLPLVYGDYRFATIEWWTQYITKQNSTKKDNFEKWKQTRVSFLKRRWCIPHLLKRLWLMNEQSSEDSTPHSALIVFLEEANVPLESALECLKDRLAVWESSSNKMQNLHTIYLDFQSSVLFLSHLAPSAFVDTTEDDSCSIKTLAQWTKFICEFSQKLISTSFSKLETDLSCWVKTTGVLLSAMLHEEVPILLITLFFWERYYYRQKLQIPGLLKIITDFSVSLKSLLEIIIQYLNLVDDMDIERVTTNVMVLLGMMQKKCEDHSFQSDVIGKDIDALSIYIEQLNLEDFDLCDEWTLWPEADLSELKELLQGVFTENKQCSEALLKRRAVIPAVVLGSSATAAFLSNSFIDLKFKTYSYAGKTLQLLDPELAHNLAIWAGRKGLFPRDSRPDPAALNVQFWGRIFSNPLGLAAGFDKNAETMQSSLDLGFAFVEIGSSFFVFAIQSSIGSVTPLPQEGNPKPRVFRIPQKRHSSIFPLLQESMKLNPHGNDFTPEINHRDDYLAVIGVNLGVNKENATDWRTAMRDYILGLRVLQSQKEFRSLVLQIRKARDEMKWSKQGPPPLLVKIAPDLTEQDKTDIARVALRGDFDGLIISNTTTTRTGIENEKNAHEAGGMSGDPLFDQSTALLKEMYALTKGSVPIIGCGGVSTGRQAYEKIKSGILSVLVSSFQQLFPGATLVQLYTAMIYEGPVLIPKIKAELMDCLQQDHYNELSKAIGAYHLK